MLGLKNNFHKSIVCGVGVSDSEIDNLSDVLNCKNQKLPMVYLGLPLGTNPKRKSTWQPVVDKVQKKLSLWKRKLLSFAGRLTLIKSVVSCLPLYYISAFQMPKGVVRLIEKLQATFLCGGGGVVS